MQRGFTLVELAVVLTIIGLIIGGVLVGADLIKSAQANTVFTDFKKFQSAVNGFRDKYQYLPGDMPNATQFWGVLPPSTTGSDATCDATPATGLLTCNGDGNGQIGVSTGGVNETYRLWQHLANAGLIEGQYIGTTGTNAGYSISIVAGVNAPPMKLGNSGAWIATYWGYYAPNSSTSAFGMDYGNEMQTNGAGGGSKPLTSPLQAYQVDSKFDDGLPGSGQIVASKGTAASPCTTVAGMTTDAGATYNIAYTGAASCQLNFPKAF